VVKHGAHLLELPERVGLRDVCLGLHVGDLHHQSRELVIAARRRRSLRPELWNMNRGVGATMWKGNACRSVCPSASAALTARGATLRDKVVWCTAARRRSV